MPRWLCDENGNQVTPSVDGITIHHEDPTEYARKRFTTRREGLDVIWEPIKDPSLYWKYPTDPDYFDPPAKTEDKMGGCVDHE